MISNYVGLVFWKSPLCVVKPINFHVTGIWLLLLLLSLNFLLAHVVLLKAQGLESRFTTGVSVVKVAKALANRWTYWWSVSVCRGSCWRRMGSTS